MASRPQNCWKYRARASDGKGDVRATKPVAKLRPFARALHHIGQGKPERIDLHGVAADIHKRGTAGLPGPLELWLCDYLEGNIETRGRKGESALERRLIGRYVSHYYDAIRKAQKGDPDTLPEAVISYQQYASKCSDSYVGEQTRRSRVWPIQPLPQPTETTQQFIRASVITGFVKMLGCAAGLELASLSPKFPANRENAGKTSDFRALRREVHLKSIQNLRVALEFPVRGDREFIELEQGSIACIKATKFYYHFFLGERRPVDDFSVVTQRLSGDGLDWFVFIFNSLMDVVCTVCAT